MPTSRRTFLKSAAASAAPFLLPSRVWAAMSGAEDGGEHLDNPFAGASLYRNVDYVAAVKSAAELEGGGLGRQMRQVAGHPTFLWLDSIAAVNGTKGHLHSLAGHLDEALAATRQCHWPDDLQPA